MLARDLAAPAPPPAEPRLHTHVTDRLPDEHPLARTRVHCDRCEALLHLQTNSCMRTWVESGRGNHCVRCFLLVAGGLAPNDTGLAGIDCLPRGFGLETRGRIGSRPDGRRADRRRA